MCKVHDGEPELARLSRLRKSQIKGLLVPRARAPASSTGEAVCHARASSGSKASYRKPWLALPLRPLAARGEEQETGGVVNKVRSASSEGIPCLGSLFFAPAQYLFNGLHDWHFEILF